LGGQQLTSEPQTKGIYISQYQKKIVR